MIVLLAYFFVALALPAAIPGLLLIGTGVDLMMPLGVLNVYSNEWALLGSVLGLGARQIFKGGLPRLPHSVGNAFLPVALMFALHALWPGPAAATLKDFLRASQFWLGLALPLWLLRDESLDLTFKAAALFVGLAAAYGLLQTWMGPGAAVNLGREGEVFYGSHQAASGFFQHHNQFAAFLIAGLGMNVTAWGLGLAGAALLASYSRGAWLSLAAGIAAMSWAVPKRWLFGFLGVALILILALPAFRTRAYSLLSSPQNSDRVLIWSLGKEMAKKSPLWGSGAGTVNRELPQRIEALPLRPQDKPSFKSHLHNQWLQWAVEYGILGALCWAAFFFYLFSAACRAARHPELRVRRYGLALGVAVLAFCAQSLTDLLLLHARGLQISLLWGLCLAGIKRG